MTKKTASFFTLWALSTFLCACTSPTGNLSFGSESSEQSAAGQSAHNNSQSLSWSLPLPKQTPKPSESP